jgi:50S ribosomal protein L16 3-hydroxylase
VQPCYRRRRLSTEVKYWSATARRVLFDRPVVFKPPKEIPRLVEPDEAFAALCASTDRLKNGRRLMQEAPFSCFIGDAELVARHDRWVPRRSDSTLAGFVDRVSPRLGDEDIGFQIKFFQSLLGPRARAKLTAFLEGVFQVAGIPAEGVGLDFFAGRYRCTPFGAHRDSADIFHFVIEGRKRMRLWKPSVFRGRVAPGETLKDYDDLVSRSLVLEGEPGDVMYWPPEWWHVGETDGDPSACLSVALFYVGDLSTRLERRLISGARSTLPPDRLVCGVPDSVAGAHRDLRRVRRQLERGLKQLDPETDAWIETLDLVSGYGFRAPDPLRKVPPIGPSMWVRLASGMRLLHAQTDRSEIVSGNGRSHSMPRDPGIAAVVKRLASGQSLRVDGLAGSATRTREARLELLRSLLSFGAIERTQPPAPTRSARVPGRARRRA